MSNEEEPMLQWFENEHLPEQLRKVSEGFRKMAEELTRAVERSPERTVALRKLLESKDAAVRAKIAETKQS